MEGPRTRPERCMLKSLVRTGSGKLGIGCGINKSARTSFFTLSSELKMRRRVLPLLSGVLKRSSGVSMLLRLISNAVKRQTASYSGTMKMQWRKSGS